MEDHSVCVDVSCYRRRHTRTELDVPPTQVNGSRYSCEQIISNDEQVSCRITDEINSITYRTDTLRHPPISRSSPASRTRPIVCQTGSMAHSFVSRDKCCRHVAGLKAFKL